jgi:predicted ribosomally synthesized peptide with SipW-like signal peptide
MMNKKLILGILLIGVLAFGAGLGTFAWFTAGVASTSNTFTTGTLALDDGIKEAFDLTGTVGNLKPSDVTRLVSLDIVNDGSLDLAWFGKFVVTNDEFTLNGVQRSLTEAMYIDYMKMEFLKPDGGSWEPKDEFIVNGRGAGTYARHFEGLVDQKLQVITLKSFLKDNTMGAGPGVQMGALKPGYSYRLSFRLGLAPLANNDYQGRTMNIGYQVNATQLNPNALVALFEGIDYLTGNGSAHEAWLNQQLAKQN